ncbi:MAG: serine/threonine protein kinase [Phycisphaerae bacterium]|nr:serine/threonine protein kinase [Phycisphaerae bacterium]
MAHEQSDPNQKSASLSDTQLARAAVDARFATEHEIQACVAKRDKLREQGREVKLADIMLKAGFITPSQIRRLNNPSEDTGSQTFMHLPGFQIKQKIGAGAMASVYKAKQLSLDRIVAIKILPKKLSEDPEFVERFYKEGKAAAKLNHANIVQAIDVGEYSGYHYFVMEFVDGETVYDELIRNRVYSESDALNVIIQIAKALDHAHEKGLIHRDVKPKNIMITKDKVAKLADMGLARLADDVAAAEAEKGRAFGTPYYISPEQIRGVADVDSRADIYSLGATLYHMVTGKVPFDGSTPASIMQKHLKQPLIPPDHLNKSLSTGLAEVVERMMAKDRNLRYRSTKDLLIDLERVREGKSPLQARSAFSEEILESLTDGSREEITEISRSRGGGTLAVQTVYPPWLVAVAVIQLALIVVLVVLLTLLR